MTNEKLLRIESSQRQHFEVLQHQSKMNLLVEQQEMSLFVMLKPEVKIYNGKWHVIHNKYLFGEGETLIKAIYDFNKQFNQKP